MAFDYNSRRWRQGMATCGIVQVWKIEYKFIVLFPLLNFRDKVLPGSLLPGGALSWEEDGGIQEVSA